MKKKQLAAAAALVGVIAACGAIFFGSAYFYLKLQQRGSEADTGVQSVPYYAAAPDTAGVLFCFANGSGVLFAADFAGGQMTVLPLGECTADTKVCCGYPVTDTVEADDLLVAGLIDRIGGIELSGTDGTTLRYTGVQVTVLLAGDDGESLRIPVLKAVLARIAAVGFTKQDFIYLIENSKTDLTVPECFLWPDYLNRLCANAQIVTRSETNGGAS